MVQTEVLYKQMTVYAVLFTFDELHSMALLNARFWQSSGFADEHWVAYVPPGFKSLAFMADEIVEYPENLCLYRSYSEVSETIRGGLYNLWRSRFWISVFYRLRLRNDWLRRALRLSATPRARHFFYGSGISSWAVRDAREKYRDERLRILLAQDFTVLVDGEVVLQSPDLTASYHQRFSRLAAAISEGMRLVVLSGGGGRMPFFGRETSQRRQLCTTQTQARCEPWRERFCLKARSCGILGLRAPNSESF